MLELSPALLFATFILGIQHAVEPENIAISFLIGSSKEVLKYSLIYLLALTFTDVLLGSFIIYAGQHFIRLPEWAINLFTGMIFIVLGLTFMRERLPKHLHSIETKEIRIVGIAGAGLLHTFILDPHHPFFFAMLAMLGDVIFAKSALLSFVLGLVTGTVIIVVTIAVISVRLNEKKLNLLRRSGGAIAIVVGIIHLIALAKPL